MITLLYTGRAARFYEPLGPSIIWLNGLRLLQWFLNPIVYVVESITSGVQRRWRRERRRRMVGRAYDMAAEVARALPPNADVLDVGCGSGFIAHHLSAILGGRVKGLDVRKYADAPIDYHSFDGKQLPVPDESFDAVLLCYVLHHAGDQQAFLAEARRVLRHTGMAVIYEDVPEGGWNRLMCRLHERSWKARTGPCTFRLESEWREVFESAGFEVITERRLSRWRNLAHPVSRCRFLLRASSEAV